MRQSINQSINRLQTHATSNPSRQTIASLVPYLGHARRPHRPKTLHNMRFAPLVIYEVVGELR